MDEKRPARGNLEEPIGDWAAVGGGGGEDDEAAAASEAVA